MDTTKRVLVVVAAPAEVRAVWAGLSAGLGLGIAWPGEAWAPARVGRFDVVESGVGKANAAGATARFARADEHAGIVSLGIGGALPESGLRLGAVVLSTASVFADEGVQAGDGFRDIAAMGFPPTQQWSGVAMPPDAALNAQLAPLAEREGAIATVSTCSGTDELAREVVRRTGAIVEAMEGAAVLQAAARVGLGGAEVRVVSNTTGARSRQAWDLRGALEGLERLSRGLAVRLR